MRRWYMYILVHVGMSKNRQTEYFICPKLGNSFVFVFCFKSFSNWKIMAKNSSIKIKYGFPILSKKKHKLNMYMKAMGLCIHLRSDLNGYTTRRHPQPKSWKWSSLALQSSPVTTLTTQQKQIRWETWPVSAMTFAFCARPSFSLLHCPVKSGSRMRWIRTGLEMVVS